MFAHNPARNDALKLQMKLQTALKYARVTCALGACNKYDDYLKSNGWTTIQRYLTLTNGSYVKLSDPAKPNSTSPTKTVFNGDHDIDLNPEINFDNRKGNKPSFANSHWFYSTNYYAWIGWFERFLPIVQTKGNTTGANSKGVYADPVEDPTFNLTPEVMGVVNSAIVSRMTRHGTCDNYTSLIFMYLWQHSEGIHRIEMMRKPGFDHVFVVVNRTGSPDDPNTWGDAWIIDGWYKDGIIYHAREYLQKIEEIIAVYSKELDQLLSDTGTTKIENPCNVQKNAVLAGVEPAHDVYPTYDNHRSFFDYYEFTDGRFLPLNTFEKIKKEEANHKNKMQAALADVRLFRNDQSSVKPSNIPAEKKVVRRQPG